MTAGRQPTMQQVSQQQQRSFKHDSPFIRGVQSTPKDASASSKLWIINPLVDMLFVCGGMLWLLVAVASLTPSLFATKTAPLFMVLTQIGAVFFLNAHNAATIVRICTEKELRERHQIIWLWAPLVLSCLLALSLLHETLLSVCLKVYTSLVPHHLTAQSYGICSMYFSRAKAIPTRLETKALKLAFGLMAVSSVLRNFSSNAVSELMGMPVPPMVLVPESLCWYFVGLSWLSSIFAFGIILRRILKDGSSIPAGAFMLGLSTLILLTLGPSVPFAVVFSSAFLHASQYLVVSGLVHLKKAGRSSLQIPSPLFRHSMLKAAVYWGQTIILGTLVYLALPTALGQLGIPLTKAVVAVLCFASLHHFLADSLIWRMRDPKMRVVLSA